MKQNTVAATQKFSKRASFETVEHIVANNSRIIKTKTGQSFVACQGDSMMRLQEYFPACQRDPTIVPKNKITLPKLREIETPKNERWTSLPTMAELIPLLKSAIRRGYNEWLLLRGLGNEKIFDERCSCYIIIKILASWWTFSKFQTSEGWKTGSLETENMLCTIGMWKTSENIPFGIVIAFSDDHNPVFNSQILSNSCIYSI